MDNNELFKSNIIRLRNSLNLTQSELAEMCDLSLGGYQQYEYGKRSPKSSIAVKIAKALNVTVDELYKDPFAQQPKAPTKKIGDMTPEELSAALDSISKKNHDVSNQVIKTNGSFEHKKETEEELLRSLIVDAISGKRLCDKNQLSTIVRMIETFAGKSIAENKTKVG